MSITYRTMLETSNTPSNDQINLVEWLGGSGSSDSNKAEWRLPFESFSVYYQVQEWTTSFTKNMASSGHSKLKVHGNNTKSQTNYIAWTVFIALVYVPFTKLILVHPYPQGVFL